MVAKRKEKKEEKEEELRHQDFGEEFVRHKVKIYLGDGKEIEGVVLEGRRYFYKVVTEQGKLYYVNKAFVACVEIMK